MPFSMAVASESGEMVSGSKGKSSAAQWSATLSKWYSAPGTELAPSV